MTDPSTIFILDDSDVEDADAVDIASGDAPQPSRRRNHHQSPRNANSASAAAAAIDLTDDAAPSFAGQSAIDLTKDNVAPSFAARRIHAAAISIDLTRETPRSSLITPTDEPVAIDLTRSTAPASRAPAQSRQRGVQFQGSTFRDPSNFPFTVPTAASRSLRDHSFLDRPLRQATATTRNVRDYGMPVAVSAASRAPRNASPATRRGQHGSVPSRIPARAAAQILGGRASTALDRQLREMLERAEGSPISVFRADGRRLSPRQSRQPSRLQPAPAPKSSPEPPSGRKRKQPPEPYLTPMEKGKAMVAPSGYDALNMHYPHLKAPERTTVLYNLLPTTYSKKWTHEWRVKFEKGKTPSSLTLWETAKALGDVLTKSKVVIPEKSRAGKYKGGDDNDEDDRKPPAQKAKSATDNPPPSPDSKTSTIPIGPLSGEVLDTLYMFFRAYVNRVHHKAQIDAIESLDEESAGASDGLTCSVCADVFSPVNVVACTGEEKLHFFCKSCFVNYATVTVESGPIQSIKCPVPECGSLFATADVKANLSQFDQLMIEHRENSRDRRVALAAKAVLHCVCGAVGIITDDFVGNNGRVECPGEHCNRVYCYKCGNEAHGSATCPPPAETVQWLDKNSKECPNCHNRIEKNGGCDHMTCRPPGGCGYEFWFSCGCPFPKHRNECGKG